jgi:iron transport multicopper oxidase
MRTAFLVNNATFRPNSVPVLLQILSGTKKASDLLPAASIYGLRSNKSVELTIPGGVVGGPVGIQLFWGTIDCVATNS